MTTLRNSIFAEIVVYLGTKTGQDTGFKPGKIRQV
jgi:hypothetical protein